MSDQNPQKPAEHGQPLPVYKTGSWPEIPDDVFQEWLGIGDPAERKVTVRKWLTGRYRFETEDELSWVCSSVEVDIANPEGRPPPNPDGNVAAVVKEADGLPDEAEDEVRGWETELRRELEGLRPRSLDRDDPVAAVDEDAGDAIDQRAWANIVQLIDEQAGERVADYTSRCQGRIEGDVLYVWTPGDGVRDNLRLDLIRDAARTAGLTIQNCKLAGNWTSGPPPAATPVKAKRPGGEPEFAMNDKRLSSGAAGIFSAEKDREGAVIIRREFGREGDYIQLESVRRLSPLAAKIWLLALAYAGMTGEKITPGMTIPDDVKWLSVLSKMDLEEHGRARRLDKIFVRTSMYHLLKDLGLPAGGWQYRQVETALREVGKVSVEWREGKRMSWTHIMEGDLDDETGDLILLINALNAKVLLGKSGGGYVHHNLIGMADLSDKAFLIRIQLERLLDPGESSDPDMPVRLDTVVSWVYPGTAKTTSAKRMRRLRVRKALTELVEGHGWGVTYVTTAARQTAVLFTRPVIADKED